MGQIRPLAGARLDIDCLEALGAWLGSSTYPASVPRVRRDAGTLTDREIGVLREVVKGHTNRQIAQALFIGEKNGEHHLDHVFGKLGVSTRTSAVVYAMESGLLG